MSKRVRFFAGQLLTAADFEAELTYHTEMRRLHNCSLHGVSVVEGAQRSEDDSEVAEPRYRLGLLWIASEMRSLWTRPVRLDVSPCKEKYAS
jgi:hypothetical protein